MRRLLRRSSVHPSPRTIRRVVRFRDDELAAVSAYALACGRPVARFIREVALGIAVRPKPARVSAEFVRHLTNLANRLTALADAAHQAGRTDEEAQLRAAVQETVAMIARTE